MFILGLVTGQEDKDKWAHFSDISRGESSSTKYDTSSISSEADSIDDVWCMTDEQRDYYIKQFTTMQSDLNGVISGNVITKWFTMSVKLSGNFKDFPLNVQYY